MQEFFVDKFHLFKFLSISDKLQLRQLKITTSSRSKVQASLTAWMFSSVRGNTIKDGEMPYLYKASPAYKAR